MNEARVALEQARRELTRTGLLANSGSITTQFADTARNTFAAAKNRLHAPTVASLDLLAQAESNALFFVLPP